MSAVKVPYGKPVKLLVDIQGFPDGRLVQYKILRKTDSGEEEVAHLNGVTRGKKALALWQPNFFEGTTFELDDKPSTAVISEKYYFIAKIDDKEVKSTDMEFTFPLTIFLREDNEPIDGIKCTLTFSDGTKKEANLSKGFARFDGVPLGKFSVDVEGYSHGSLFGVLKR